MITNHIQYAPFSDEAIVTRTPYVRGYEIRFSDPHRHKYGSAMAEYLDLCEDEGEATGSVEWSHHVRRFGKRHLCTDDRGFVFVVKFASEDEAIADFEAIDTEYCEWENEDEEASAISAAEWWVQENIGGRATGDVRETARLVLQGIDEGDPAVLDSLEGTDEDTIANACRELLADSSLDDLRGLNCWQLARLAECHDPDTNLSMGADFLRGVRDSLVERLADSVRLDEDETSDLAHEIADSAPSIYTHQLWSEFLDLCAYEEDTSDFVGEGADMETRARVALYVIAERLVIALVGEAYNC